MTTPESILATQWLEEAEIKDIFCSSCQRNTCNALARQRCSYTAWPDQSLAKKASEYIPLDLREKVHVVILNPSAEGGMPHTRPNLICLPAYFPDSLVESTMKHELLHIDQRINETNWMKKLVKDGWVEETQASVPEDWLRKCRLNPDTWNSRFWSWEDRYIPLPIFDREDQPSMTDFAVFWYDKKSEKAIRRAPDGYVQQYGSVSQSAQEHPYELFAYI
jgi:hypothetical protein